MKVKGKDLKNFKGCRSQCDQKVGSQWRTAVWW